MSFRDFLLSEGGAKVLRIYFINELYLTKRQADVLILKIRGYSNKKIAEEYFKPVSVRTIKAHISHIVRAFNKHLRSKGFEPLRSPYMTNLLLWLPFEELFKKWQEIWGHKVYSVANTTDKPIRANSLRLPEGQVRI